MSQVLGTHQPTRRKPCPHGSFILLILWETIQCDYLVFFFLWWILKTCIEITLLTFCKDLNHPHLWALIYKIPGRMNCLSQSTLPHTYMIIPVEVTETADLASFWHLKMVVWFVNFPIYIPVCGLLCVWDEIGEISKLRSKNLEHIFWDLPKPACLWEILLDKVWVSAWTVVTGPPVLFNYSAAALPSPLTLSASQILLESNPTLHSTYWTFVNKKKFK